MIFVAKKDAEILTFHKLWGGGVKGWRKYEFSKSRGSLGSVGIFLKKHIGSGGLFGPLV